MSHGPLISLLPSPGLPDHEGLPGMRMAVALLLELVITNPELISQRSTVHIRAAAA